MRGKRLLCVLCVMALASLVNACGYIGRARSNAAERQPFSRNVVSGDGVEVRWEGYSDGYRPDTAETMRLDARNDMFQPWDGRFCVQLLEPGPSGAVVPLAQQEFVLEPASGFTQNAGIELPRELQPGSYGLALVVHTPSGPLMEVVVVQIGEGEIEPFHGQWPTEAALAACPAPAALQRVHLDEAGLSLEVPGTWIQVGPEVWAQPDNDSLRLGMRWADLQPPQEPEAALLPQPSQVLDSAAVQMPWGSGRRVTLEVYGEAPPGGGKAPIRAVETHLLVVVEQDGGRRAFDLYVSAPNDGQLTGLEAILLHALASVDLS